MPKVRRPCPRGLYDGCPIPRELCTEDHEKTGKWHCLAFLNELEFFLFGRPEEKESDAFGESAEIDNMEELLRVLEGKDEDY